MPIRIHELAIGLMKTLLILAAALVVVMWDHLTLADAVERGSRNTGNQRNEKFRHVPHDLFARAALPCMARAWSSHRGLAGL